MLIETLKELCALPGVSGCEDAVREYIMRRASKVSGDIVTDPMGNLIVNVKGKKTPEKKIMLAAHMDEVGVIVTGFTDGGFLKFDFVGGVDRRVVIGKKVDIQTDEGVLPGVIGLKPVHLLEGEEKRRVPPTGSMYIDLGFDSREDAEKIAAIQLDLSTYAENTMAQFVAGDLPLSDEEWDKFCRTVEEKGLGRMIEIWQKYI